MAVPIKGVAFPVGFCLYKSDGTLIANPGTLTAKISKDFGDYANIGTVTEEDTTYGQLKAALTATEMNADTIMLCVVDDTSGCVPFTLTINPFSAALATAADLDDIPTATENADALLNRDMSAVSDTTARSPLNALRALRNKVSIAAGTMTVTKENDSTAAWTATLTTDAAAEPITTVDPG